MTKFRTGNNDFIKKLLDRKYKSVSISMTLKTNCAVTQKNYGHLKLHKKGVPIRPILSCIGAPGYSLSKFLNDILRSLCPEFQFTIRNSYDVVGRWAGLTIPDVYILVSLDVRSLFTNMLKI